MWQNKQTNNMYSPIWITVIGYAIYKAGLPIESILDNFQPDVLSGSPNDNYWSQLEQNSDILGKTTMSQHLRNRHF